MCKEENVKEKFDVGSKEDYRILIVSNTESSFRMLTEIVKSGFNTIMLVLIFAAIYLP